MTRVVVLAALLGACVSDHYECETDRDCDLGVAGRCEVDHHCTAYDGACATTRRYTAHAGELSNACYEPAITDFNPCASGQPPASRDDACAADVCQALPSCCDTGWSAACVQRAQLACESLHCDFRAALTLIQPTSTELFVLESDGDGLIEQLIAHPAAGLEGLATYLAPAPGTIEPRLAGLGDGGATFVIDTGTDVVRIPLTATRNYQDAASVDLDRDLRDTIALDWQDPTAGTTGLEIIKPETGDTRSIVTDAASQHEAWGDQDRDAFPDVILGQGTRYTFLGNRDDDAHRRTLLATGTQSVTAGETNATALRTFDWADVDGDTALDLVVFGNAVVLHLADPLVTNIVQFRVDCDPPYRIAGGNQCADFATIQFVGAAVPQADGTSELVIGNDVTRNLYRVTVHHTEASDTIDVVPMTFIDPCPGPGAVCKPIRAVIARDLDGDHVIDVLAFDADLNAYYTGSRTDPTGLKLTWLQPITGGADYTSVRISVTGAPTP